MSFGVALRNAVSIGLGGIISFVSGDTSIPPAISNGILLENNVDFLMMEDGTSYLLQEA